MVHKALTWGTASSQIRDEFPTNSRRTLSTQKPPPGGAGAGPSWLIASRLPVLAIHAAPAPACLGARVSARFSAPAGMLGREFCALGELIEVLRDGE